MQLSRRRFVQGTTASLLLGGLAPAWSQSLETASA